MTTGAERLIRRFQAVREAERLAKRVYYEPFPGEELYGDTVRASLQVGLVGYWPLDEVSGTRRDISGKGYNLTDNNTVTRGAGPNEIPFAGQFTAANSEYLSRADNADLSAGDRDFTVAAWVNYDTVVGTILSKWHVANQQNEYLLDVSASEARFVVDADGLNTTFGIVTRSGALSTGTWYFIVAWHDSVGNTVNIQVNDEAPTSTAYSSGVFNGTADFDIGARSTPNIYHNGRISAVGRWNKLLSAAEIAWLYNAGKGRVMAG